MKSQLIVTKYISLANNSLVVSINSLNAGMFFKRHGRCGNTGRYEKKE